MEIPALTRSLSVADLPLEKLATSTQLSDTEKIAEISRQFEAVLLRQILSEAQKPLFKSSLLQSESSTNGIYQDMLVEQLADRISRGGTFGFAKVLEHELSAQYINKEQQPEALTHPAHGSATQSPHAIRDQEGQRKRDRKGSDHPEDRLENGAPPSAAAKVHDFHRLQSHSNARSNGSNAISDSRMIPATHQPSADKRDAHRPRKNEPQPGKRI
jgi:Rod binding domain-containing protein